MDSSALEQPRFNTTAAVQLSCKSSMIIVIVLPWQYMHRENSTFLLSFFPIFNCTFNSSEIIWRWEEKLKPISQRGNRMHVHVHFSFYFSLLELLEMSLSCFLYHCGDVLTSTRLKSSNATGYRCRLDLYRVSYRLSLSSSPFFIPQQ